MHPQSLTSPPPDPRYASATALVADCWRAFAPPERISVADYAASHRFLANEGGGFVGRWDHTVAPYLVEPMESLRSSLFLTTAIVGPGQCGKTEIAQNWLLHTVANDPADLLWYMQTDPGLEAFVKGRINPMIDAHQVMRAALGGRATDDSLHFKRFNGMRVEFLSAVMSNLINKSAPRIVADEWDAYPANLGDAKTLLDVRRQTFGRDSMLLAMSHCDQATGMDPSKDWARGILALYADSDRRTWWWRCPHCGAYSSPNPNAARVMVLDYPQDPGVPLDEIQDATRLLCPVNGCEIEDRERHAMNQTGVWVGAGQEIDDEGVVTGTLARRDIAGFWIVGAMSPFILGGIGGLARALVKAERDAEASGDLSGVKQVVVKQFGVPYQPKRAVGSVDAATLAERAEAQLSLGTVPPGVRFLTAGVDVQSNRFEILVRGWGEGGESWVVDFRRMEADPAVSASDWDALFESLLGAEYPLVDADGVFDGRAMKIRAIAYDTGGAPGVTSQAYQAWRRGRTNGAIRMRGTFDGRHGWNIIPCKGMASPNAPKLQTVYPDTQRKDRKVSAGGQVPQGQFHANHFKDDLAGQLQIGAPAPWYVHFPDSLRGNYGAAEIHRRPDAPHLWFEQLTAEVREPNGAWKKISARNEVLDLMVLSHVAAHLHGIAKIRWERPPTWAAAPDRNPMVSAVTVKVAAPEAAAGGPAQADAPPPSTAARTRSPGVIVNRDALRALARMLA